MPAMRGGRRNERWLRDLRGEAKRIGKMKEATINEIRNGLIAICALCDSFKNAKQIACLPAPLADIRKAASDLVNEIDRWSSGGADDDV